MTDSVTAILLATTTVVAACATWWVLRHERAVRRFRAGPDRTGGAAPR